MYYRVVGNREDKRPEPEIYLLLIDVIEISVVDKF